MDIAVRLVELTVMHPRLLWADLIDPVEVAPEHVSRLQRTYESSRLVELAAIIIAGLGLYYEGGHEIRVRV
jgi:hypothetical protein